MKNLGFLFWAYNVVWLGICFYLIRITLLQGRIRQRLEKLRTDLEGRGKA